MIRTTPSGTYSLSAARLVDPVAHIAHLEWSTLDASETDFAGKATVGEEETESVRRVEMTLPFPRCAPGAERLIVDGGIRAPGFGDRLPSLQPLPTSQPNFTPRFPVVGTQRSEQARAPISSVISHTRRDRVESRWILEAGKITGRIAGHDRADGTAKHLRTSSLREHGRESYGGWLERRTERINDTLRDLRTERVVGAHTRPEYGENPKAFALQRVGNPYRSCFQQSGCPTTTVSTSAGPSRLPASLIVSSDRPCKNH